LVSGPRLMAWMNALIDKGNNNADEHWRGITTRDSHVQKSTWKQSIIQLASWWTRGKTNNLVFASSLVRKVQEAYALDEWNVRTD
jgi:hypothetical protein